MRRRAAERTHGDRVALTGGTADVEEVMWGSVLQSSGAQGDDFTNAVLYLPNYYSGMTPSDLPLIW